MKKGEGGRGKGMMILLMEWQMLFINSLRGTAPCDECIVDSMHTHTHAHTYTCTHTRVCKGV